MGERDLAGHHRLGSAARTYGRAGCESARRTLPAELKKASARSTCQPMAVPSPGRRRRTRPDANRRIFADPLIDTYSYRKRCACAREDLETTTTARHARARSCSQPATNRALHPLMRYGRVPAAAGWPHGTCVPRQESPIDHRERGAGGHTYGFDRCGSYGSRGWMDSSLPIWRRPFLLARRGPVPFLGIVGVALVPWRLVTIFLTALLLTQLLPVQNT
jgi:hypothetical protein